MKKTTKILALLLAVVLAFGCTACGKTESAPAAEAAPAAEPVNALEKAEAPAPEVPAEASYADEVIIGIGGDVSNLNPIQDTSLIESQMLYYCTHQTLVYYDPLTHDFAPDVAESWELSDDGLTWTFKLYQGIKFHNGDELKASDVKFSLERAIGSSTQKSRVSFITAVDVIDDYTIAITMNAKFADAFYNLAQPNIAIVSEKAVTELGDDGEAVGSGPYYVTDYAPGDHIKLERFEDYIGELPPTKHLTFKIITEDAARVIALQAGDIDICFSPAYVDQQFILDDPNLTLVTRNGVVTQFLAMNTQIEPFNNQKVRQAIAYAVNKEDCIKVAFGDTAYVATGVMPDDVPLCTKIDGIPYDVETAKALLAEAGYADGFEMEMTCFQDVQEKMAQVIQENLKEIGITVNIVRVELNAQTDAIINGNFESVLRFFSNGSGPSSSFDLPFAAGSASNSSKVNDTWLDEQMAIAGAENDTEVRKELYKTLNEYIIDQGYWVPLAIPNVYVGIQKDVDGISYGANTRHDFSYCYKLEG